MNRFIPTFWLTAVLSALVALLLAGTVVSAQPITQPRDETILSGFLSCTGVNGERQCPFRVHYIEMVRGRTYALRLESTEFNTNMIVEDEHGNLMARDTDDFDTMPGCVVFRPTVTGTYRLVVSALPPLNEGLYFVRIRELPVVFVVEDEMTGNEPMAADCRVRSYDVAMMAGERYVIDLVSRDFSPYLKLLDADGMIVAFEDESCAPRGARIVYTPTRTATYRIVATTFEPRVLGAFMLSVSRDE